MTQRMPDETLTTALHLLDGILSRPVAATVPEMYLAKAAVAELQDRIAEKTTELAAEKNRWDELLLDFSWAATRAASNGDPALHDFWKEAHHSARIHAGRVAADSQPVDCDCKTNYPAKAVSS